MLYNPSVPSSLLVVPSGRVAVAELLEPRQLMSAQTAVTQESYLGGTQLRVQGTDGDDQIVIRSDPSLGLVVTNSADAYFLAYGGAVKTIRVDGGTGNDSIVIDPSVGLPTLLYGGDGDDVLVGGRNDDRLYGGGGNNSLDGFDGDDVLVTVGGGVTDRLTGGIGRDSFWLDAKRTEAVTDLSLEEVLTRSFHRVGAFFSRVRDPLARTAQGNVSLGAGDLADPAVSESRFVYSNFTGRPLFSDAGPRPDDINQGAIGDCYSLAVLSSMASLDPTRLRESVVELGDGTYVVQFRRGSSRAYVRVDGDLPVYSGTADPSGGPGAGGVPAYAELGAQESLWVAVIEKAYAVVRSETGGYTALDGGWMRETYGLFGSRSRSFWTSSIDLLTRTIQLLLASGRSVTFATTSQVSAGTPLLTDHAYSVVSVTLNSVGTVISIQLRNPWGVDGAGSDGADDGYVTITAQQAIESLAGMCTAFV